MCRNIRVLHHFEPPTTPEEIRAAALQYVRKVSGVRAPAKANAPPDREIERAIEAIAKATTRLLEHLPERGTPRTREGERNKARARWTAREERITTKSASKESGSARR
jgi:hypothetical protein